MENGGNGIYAACSLCYLENSIDDIKDFLRPMGLAEMFVTDKGIYPNAEKIHPQLMQFTTNQKDEEEMKIQADALEKTIRYFS